jgi:oxygen-independent coproporphyrinogen III oxidase
LIGVKALERGALLLRVMDERLILAERTVPRYTSYPTAPHFTPAVDAHTYAAWLSELPATATLSLYLHVPYCPELCLYCGCQTKAIRQRDRIDLYADCLATEIAMISAAATGHRVTHLHWGGGTPSILGEARLLDLSGQLRDTFDLSRITEHAIELDPRRLTESLVGTLRQIGINRASFGVQDFAPHVQAAIGRVQPFEQVEAAVALLRDAGIDRLNVDLMYGLPCQTVEDVKDSAERAVALRPHRLAHVPWFKPHQRLIEASKLPGPADRLDQAYAAADVLTAHGYVAIGLDHFALPHDDLAEAQRHLRLHRNFQGYTTDAADALIGLGVSAIGRLPQGFVQNHAEMGRYRRAIEERRFATAKGIPLRPDDRLRGCIIERLMCDLAVDLDAVLREYGGPSGGEFATELDALQGLAAHGLVQVEGHIIIVTNDCRPFVRVVAAVFDAYLARRQGRHSIAV